MKELIKYEFQKIIKQKSIYFVGILLIALFLVTSLPVFENKEANYEPYEGRVTEEKVELVENGWESTTDMVVERTEEERANYDVYQSFLNERSIEESVQSRIQELETKVEINNDPEAVMELAMLENISLDTFYYHDGPDQTVDFVNTFGFVLAGALILLGLFNIYSNEYATGVDNYILSSKRGRKEIVHAKLLASFLYTFLAVCVWVLFDVIYHLIRLGGSGWQSPLQYIWKYNSSPYDFTMAEYFGIQVGTHLIGALGFATLVLCISALCSKPIVSFLVSGIIFGLPVVWTSILSQESNWLIDISFTNIMKVEELYLNFSVYDVAGMYILKPIFLIILSIIFSLAFIYATYLYIRRIEV